MTCADCGKESYANRGLAERVAERIRRRMLKSDRSGFHVYRCDAGRWHFGHSGQRRRVA